MLVPSSYISKNVAYFSLEVGKWVDIAYNQNLENFLTTIGHNNKYEAMIGGEKPLIKKKAASKIARLV